MLDIEKKLETLPVLPEKVNHLLNLNHEQNYDTKKLLHIIQNDPILTTRLLELANSKYFGFLNPIYTPGRALSLYGMHFTIAVCIAELVLNSLKFDLKAFGISYFEFKRISDSAFKLLFEWLDETQVDLKEKLILPLFLQYIGKFFISEYIKKENKQENFKLLLENKNESRVEKDFVGISSSELSSIVLKRWGFPQQLVDTVFYIDTPMFLETSVKEVAILNTINQITKLNAPFEVKSIQNGLRSANEFDLNVNRLRDIVHKIEEDFKK